jgi:hypothetical protein
MSRSKLKDDLDKRIGELLGELFDGSLTLLPHDTLGRVQNRLEQHSYTNPEDARTERALQGIVEKLRLHSMYQESDVLRESWTSFKHGNRESFEQGRTAGLVGVIDPETSNYSVPQAMLVLLMHLSGSPTDVNLRRVDRFRPKGAANQDEDDDEDGEASHGHDSTWRVTEPQTEDDSNFEDDVDMAAWNEDYLLDGMDDDTASYYTHDDDNDDDNDDDKDDDDCDDVSELRMHGGASSAQSQVDEWGYPVLPSWEQLGFVKDSTHLRYGRPVTFSSKRVEETERHAEQQATRALDDSVLIASDASREVRDATMRYLPNALRSTALLVREQDIVKAVLDMLSGVSSEFFFLDVGDDCFYPSDVMANAGVPHLGATALVSLVAWFVELSNLMRPCRLLAEGQSATTRAQTHDDVVEAVRRAMLTLVRGADRELTLLDASVTGLSVPPARGAKPANPLALPQLLCHGSLGSQDGSVTLMNLYVRLQQWSELFRSAAGLARTVLECDRRDPALVAGLLQELLVSVDAAGTLDLDNLEGMEFGEGELDPLGYAMERPDERRRLELSLHEAPSNLYAVFGVHVFSLALDKYLQRYFDWVWSDGSRSNARLREAITRCTGLGQIPRTAGPAGSRETAEGIILDALLEVPLFLQGLSVQALMSGSDMSVLQRRDQDLTSSAVEALVTSTMTAFRACVGRFPFSDVESMQDLPTPARNPALEPITHEASSRTREKIAASTESFPKGALTNPYFFAAYDELPPTFPATATVTATATATATTAAATHASAAEQSNPAASSALDHRDAQAVGRLLPAYLKVRMAVVAPLETALATFRAKSAGHLRDGFAIERHTSFLRLTFLLGDPKLWDALRGLAKQDQTLAPLGLLRAVECETLSTTMCESVTYEFQQLVPDDSIPHITVTSNRGAGDASSAAVLAFELAGSVGVEMHHRWPLGEVFSAPAMDAYNQHLRFLLQLYCVRWAAEDVWAVVTKSRVLLLQGQGQGRDGGKTDTSHNCVDEDPWTERASPATTPATTPDVSPEKRKKKSSYVGTGPNPSPTKSRAVKGPPPPGQAQKNRCLAGMVWALHTVNALQTFFMERLQQNLCTSLLAALGGCSSLMEMINVHDQFLREVLATLSTCEYHVIGLLRSAMTAVHMLREATSTRADEDFVVAEAAFGDLKRQTLRLVSACKEAKRADPAGSVLTEELLLLLGESHLGTWV